MGSKSILKLNLIYHPEDREEAQKLLAEIYYRFPQLTGNVRFISSEHIQKGKCIVAKDLEISDAFTTGLELIR